MNYSKILNWIFGIMAFIGVFLIIGAVGASDYAVEMGIYQSFQQFRQQSNRGLMPYIMQPRTRN